MNEHQKDLVAAYTLMGIFVVAIGVCIALLITGCDGEIPGTGPTVTTAHPELRAPFYQAIDVVGDSLQRDMGADPALVLDVTLLDGEGFTSGDVLDGAPLWGRNQFALTGKGPRCLITLALRVPAPEVLPSNTSLAHEAAHCALDWQWEPDGMHEQRWVWDWVVPRANEALEADGL